MCAKKINFAFFTIFVIGLFFSISIQATSVLIPSISDASKLTPDFNTKLWDQAVAFDEFVTTKGDIASVKTKVRIMHDKNNLYVGFECFDQDPKQLTISSTLSA